jgi:hypothetical protein
LRKQYEGDEDYYHRRLKALGVEIEDLRKSKLTLTKLHDLLVGIGYLAKKYGEASSEMHGAKFGTSSTERDSDVI